MLWRCWRWVLSAARRSSWSVVLYASQQSRMTVDLHHPQVPCKPCRICRRGSAAQQVESWGLLLLGSAFCSCTQQRTSNMPCRCSRRAGWSMCAQVRLMHMCTPMTMASCDCSSCACLELTSPCKGFCPKFALHGRCFQPGVCSAAAQGFVEPSVACRCCA